MSPHGSVGRVVGFLVICMEIGAVLWSAVAGGGMVAAEPAYLQLRINEIIANNDSVGPQNCRCEYSDMVEIYNPTDEQIDLGGSPGAFSLSDGTTVWKFQPLQRINPHSRFVVFCDGTECQQADCCAIDASKAVLEAHADFGLDNDGESITLAGPNGEIIDVLTYPPLASDVSYARCPDGSDTLVFNSRASTSFGSCARPAPANGTACAGAPNQGPQGRCGSNVTPLIDLVDYSTNRPGSGEPVRLQAQVKDEKPPDASDISEVAIVFRLDGGLEEKAVMTFQRLVTDELNLVDQWSLWEGEIPGQIDGTVVDFYLRVKDAEGGESTAPGTLCAYPKGPCFEDPLGIDPDDCQRRFVPDGCTNECQVPYRYVVGPPYDGPLVMNEAIPENQTVLRDTSEIFTCLEAVDTCHFDDLIEIFNASSVEQDLSGLVLSSRPFHAVEGWKFPANSKIAPGRHLVIWTDADGANPFKKPPEPPDPTDPARQEFHTDFNLDGRSDEVFLFALVSRPGVPTAYQALDGLRWGKPGEAIDERDTFVAAGSSFKLWKGSAGDPPPRAAGTSEDLEWTAIGYPDSDWADARAPVGYGAAGLATVLEDMKDAYVTVFLRRTFTVEDKFFQVVSPTQRRVLLKRLFLEVAYDDGFVAYLNGRPAARRNVQGSGASAPAMAEIAPAREVFDITGMKDLLEKGDHQNVLAIEAHNASAGSDDLVLDARLFWGVEGLGDDESLSRIPDGRLDAELLKLPGPLATPGAANQRPLLSFRRGDVAEDGLVDISDPVAILGFLFLGGIAPTCMDAADVDDSGGLDIADPINLLAFLFQGGALPKPPGPLDCGPDPTGDDLAECQSQSCSG